MVAATTTRKRHRTKPLVGTDQASRMLQVPGRTVRRWVQQRGLGTLVAGRRVLTPQDVRMLRLLRDGQIN